MVKVITVDKNDKETGVEDKLRCHLGKGILHRAFTILIFNSEGRVLLQRRSRNKLLWPLIWETSCSSHPLPGEDNVSAGKKRLKRELSFSCSLSVLSKFVYRSKYKDVGSEKEVCTLLMGKYGGKIKPNKKEVAEWRWVGIKELKKELKRHPKKYAPWLKLAIKKYEDRESNLKISNKRRV